MDKKAADYSSYTAENFDWERRLEKLRQTRQLNAPYTHVPLVRQSADAQSQQPAVKAGQNNNMHKLDDSSRDQVLRQYMLRWQQEHNQAAQQEHEALETDPLVLLQENWLNAQAALQRQVNDAQLESCRQVWLNPKCRTVEFCEPQCDAESSENPSEPLSDGHDDSPEEKIKVSINVLNPQVDKRRQVFCISEQELTERLIKRMRPHVTDAVNGMIRVALQKQMALLSYQLQQMLSEQAPQVVEDVLEHNVKKVLADIKYEMKYKR